MKYRFFLLTLIFSLALFIFIKAKGYYAIGLYPIFLAFGAVYLEKLLDKDWLFYLRAVAIMIPVLVFVPQFQIILPVLSPEEIIEKNELFKKYDVTRWED